MPTTLLALLAFAACLLALYLAFRLVSLQSEFATRVQQAVAVWRERELVQLRGELATVAQQEARVALDQWKLASTGSIRQDAIQRSQAVVTGKVFEQLVPYLPGFGFNPKDARFIGSPVDFVVFDGLSEDDVRSVVFVEVKTGGSTLSTRERRVRDAILAGRIEWRELRVPESLPSPDASQPALPAAQSPEVRRPRV